MTRTVMSDVDDPVAMIREIGADLVIDVSGSIVNIGLINGIQGLPNLVAYASAKGGLLTLTRTLTGAYAAERIRVNYVIPGWVLSEGEMALHHDRGTADEELRRAGAALPLGRHQTPLDTAYAVLYLVSDESAQVTGTIMNVDAADPARRSLRRLAASARTSAVPPLRVSPIDGTTRPC